MALALTIYTVYEAIDNLGTLSADIWNLHVSSDPGLSRPNILCLDA